LAIGQSNTFVMTLLSKPITYGTFANSAQATGTGNGLYTADTSQAGNNADPDGNGNPLDNDDSTLVLLAPIVQIGLSKSVTSAPGVNNTHDVTYKIKVKNMGNVVLQQVAVFDTLSKTFPFPVQFSLTSATSSNPSVVINTGYNGLTGTLLVDSSSSTLAVADSAIITLVVNVNIDNNGPGTFYNSAFGQANGQLGTGTTSDISDNGDTTDANNDGKPDGLTENDPTPIYLDELTSEAAIPHGFSPNGDGDNDVFAIKAPLPFTYTTVGVTWYTDRMITKTIGLEQ
jgi:large repetitive protein